MEFTFLGGAGEVGRSAILMSDSINILFDYGVKIEGPDNYPLPAKRVDLCAVSHAHLDHSGSLPILYHYSLPVTFGTPPTMKLSELLIEDSMKLAKRKHEKPKFFRNQVKMLLERYVGYDYGKRFGFGNYDMTLHDAGHICGSAITVAERAKDGFKVAYTGDFKMEPQSLHNGAEVVKSDVLIIESTYALKEHPERAELERRFVNDVKETIDNGGTALIPVFAVGRSQEMLATLCKNGLIDHTYIDGMARAATEICIAHPEFFTNPDLLKEAYDKVGFVSSGYHRREIEEGGKIVVTTSGMLNGGPVLNYITKLNRNSKIFITGFQVEGTNGRRLMDGEPLVIDNRKFRVQVPFEVYDFSAHAGRRELYDYVKKSSPHDVICVHGEAESSKSFAAGLKEEGFNAHAPKVGERIKIGI